MGARRSLMNRRDASQRWEPRTSEAAPRGARRKFDPRSGGQARFCLEQNAGTTTRSCWAAPVPTIEDVVSVELVARVRAELDRLGVSYPSLGAREYAAVTVSGGVVCLLGSLPGSRRLRWQGDGVELVRRLSGLEDRAGPERLWSALGVVAE